MAIATPVEKSITAENQFTEWIFIDKNSRFAMNIYGTFVATVTLQMSYDGGTTIIDDDITYSSLFSDTSEPMAESVQIRIGVKTGDFTSGTAEVRLGRG